MARVRENPPFGKHFRFDLPKEATAVIVCENQGTGLVPLKLRLPGQIYVKDFGDVRGLTIIPIRSQEYICLADVGEVAELEEEPAP